MIDEEPPLRRASKPDQNPPDGVSLTPDTMEMVDSGAKAPIDERRLLRKIDLHVMPMLFLIYIVAFLDRQVNVDAKQETSPDSSW